MVTWLLSIFEPFLQLRSQSSAEDLQGLGKQIDCSREVQYSPFRRNIDHWRTGDGESAAAIVKIWECPGFS